MPSLLTWRLWRALRYPDESHPLYQRVSANVVRFPAGAAFLRRFQRPLGWLVVPVNVLTVLVAPAALFLASNLIGALVAFNIMTIIERERAQHTYDLVALTPTGRGQFNWLIAVSCVYRLHLMEQVTRLRTLSILTMGLLYALSLSYPLEGIALTPITLFLILIALNLDAIQTTIIACLSGMLAQRFREQGAPYAALAIFVFAQIIAVYLPVTGAAILLFDALRRTLDDHWLGSSLFALTALVLLFVLREAIIRVMWRALERRLL